MTVQQHEDFRENLIEELVEDGNEFGLGVVLERESAAFIVDFIINAGWRWRGYGLDLIDVALRVGSLVELFADVRRKDVMTFEGHVRIPTDRWLAICAGIQELADYVGLAGSDDKASEDRNG